MITHHYGDILNTTCDVICQQVNCQNVMGSGLAKYIYEKYPKVKENYHEYCNGFKKDKKETLLGDVCYAFLRHQKDSIYSTYVANLFGQYDYGRENKLYTNYGALMKAFLQVFQGAYDLGDSVAIPYKLGCGLARGDWDKVMFIIKSVSELYPDVDVEIWELKEENNAL